jgi:hypothetical protein
MNGQLHALAALSKEKELPYPLHRRLGGPQSQPGCVGEERNIWPLPGIELWFLERPSRSLAAVPTELFVRYHFANWSSLSNSVVGGASRKTFTALHLRTEYIIVRNSLVRVFVRNLLPSLTL